MTELTVGERLAESLEQFTKAFEEIKMTGLPRSIIITLLKEKTKMAKRDIKRILEAIDELREELTAQSER